MLVRAPILAPTPLLALTRAQLLQVRHLMLARPPRLGPMSFPALTRVQLLQVQRLMRALLLRGGQARMRVPLRMQARVLRLVQEDPRRPVPRGR